jgi:hypothetical protein
MEYLPCRVVLHVQEQWRDHISFATLLWLCTRIMVFDSMSFWSPLGYAGSGFVGVGTLVNIVLLIYGGAIPHSVMWTIWRERNQLTFEGVEHSSLELKLYLLSSLFEWMAALVGHSFSTFEKFFRFM